MSEPVESTARPEPLPAVGPDCATCPAHHVANLRRLGVDMSNHDFVVALAGNPNVGKSTVFNALTGLRQHTGNWPGKTVTRAEGGFAAGPHKFKLVDLPGTYSLLSTSVDEEIARNFILFGRPDVTVIVLDASRLERNLNLALQVLDITDRAVVCLNLVDEAERRGIEIDTRRLSRDLGVPVVATSARYKRGLDDLNRAIVEVATGEYVTRPHRVAHQSKDLAGAVDQLASDIETHFPELPNPRWVALRLLDGDQGIREALENGELVELYSDTAAADASTASRRPLEPEQRDGNREQGADDVHTARRSSSSIAPLLERAQQLRWRVGKDFHQKLMESIYTEAGRIADRAQTLSGEAERFDLDRTIDRLVTSRIFGFPLMLLLLTGVFWITIAGANVPSAMLATLFLDIIHPWLKGLSASLGIPWWIDGFVLDGMYLGTAWVISVMLPPMAIFFPLFTLLEDFGYLPRVAFNLDKMFHRVGAHGKQALTMAMGWGCNAAAVVSTRIIDSPRERLIAIITNNFALCNGRWPTQILIASIFIGALVPAALGGLVSALAVVAIALLGVLLTFASSWALSRTVLRGEVSTFSLELPPYRPPRVLQTLYTSIIDRTLIVLWRAVIFALPAGAVIWTISNVDIGSQSIAQWVIEFLNPFGMLIGLSGIILLAYIIAIPANEIVVPTILMLAVLATGMEGVGEGAGVMFELDSQAATREVLDAAGFTLLMAVNLMLFSLIHNPCSTTIYTIWKETRSVKWTAVSALMPVVLGLVVCFFVAQIWRSLAG